MRVKKALLFWWWTRDVKKKDKESGRTSIIFQSFNNSKD